MTTTQTESLRRAIDPTPGEIQQTRTHAAPYVEIQRRLLGEPDDERTLCLETLRRADHGARS